ncbi:hypothetical protein [Marinobacter caseinilyticus]|uniref:hypothetical protein n=1 Tax=Marinobacter caseinilyticus TaxID=2692195 RepID=UPI00140A0432|nr:hypothetical protein [Marinobacter caseinilyticus]
MTDTATTEGRTCPLHYRYRPGQLCSQPETCDHDVLYVIGGLYGNPFALDEVERMAAAEQAIGRRVKLLFNGDFNWFNADDELFQVINRRVLDHDAMLGNVEYELAHPSDGAGCGCAYPESVDNAVVERSNRIMLRLQAVAAGHPEIQRRLASLARWRCLMFGGLKVLALHGDPESLAGWGLSQESFRAGNQAQVAEWFRQTDADVMVCSHTCLPLIWSGNVAGRPRWVLNNGAAGMANLAGDYRGLITRLAWSGPPEDCVASLSGGAMSLALVPVAYDQSAWLERFDQLWPAHSDAAISYRERILAGADLSPSGLCF